MGFGEESSLLISVLEWVYFHYTINGSEDLNTMLAMKTKYTNRFTPIWSHTADGTVIQKMAQNMVAFTT